MRSFCGMVFLLLQVRETDVHHGHRSHDRIDEWVADKVPSFSFFLLEGVVYGKSHDRRRETQQETVDHNHPRVTTERRVARHFNVFLESVRERRSLSFLLGEEYLLSLKKQNHRNLDLFPRLLVLGVFHPVIAIDSPFSNNLITLLRISMTPLSSGFSPTKVTAPLSVYGCPSNSVPLGMRILSMMYLIHSL